jgi:AcrR family transcriptional regulator
MAATQWGDRTGKRRNVLAAARTLLDEQGPDELSMRRVAERAGVSPGTVYTLFAHKEELFATLYVERLEHFLAEVEWTAREQTGPEELVVAMGRRYVAIYATFGRRLDAWSMMVEREQWPAELVERLTQVTLKLLGCIEWLTRGFGLETMPADVRRRAGPLLWATLNGLAEQYSGVRHELHGLALDDLLTFSARVLVAGLRDLSAGTPTTGEQ